jgi:hypothetical protein
MPSRSRGPLLRGAAGKVWAHRSAGVAVMLSAAGCLQILGLHDRAEATDGGLGGDTDAANSVVAVAGQCGMLLHNSASCAACMDQNCCSEARACAGTPACKEASDCLASCGDATCRARCAAFYTLPDTLIALRSCRVGQCATACGSTCGEYASAVPDCQKCREASCCSQGLACASNTSCAALDLCTSNCFAAMSCPIDCQTKYPQGTTDFSSWSSCVASDQCATKCQPGQSWTCLDSPIIWPKPNAVGNITFSITFVDFSTERPFVAATIKACGKLDLSCGVPLSQGSTDTTGLVSLTVPAGLAGFDGYLDISGGKVDGTGAQTYPTIWYPVPFVVSDGWRGRTTILSDQELQLLALAGGVTALDPTRGHFAANAADCAFSPAAGVSFMTDSADAKTQPFYLVSGVPSAAATATDSSATGGFINLPSSVPAKLVLIQARAGAAGGKVMGSLTFIIRPGTLTTMSSYPPVP